MKSEKKPGKALVVVAICAMLLLSGSHFAHAVGILSDIDTKKYPHVKLSLSSLALDEINLADQDEALIKITENGRAVENVQVSSPKLKPEPLSVVLLIDSSGSMKGKPIENAKAAADHFVNLLGEEDQVSVIAFNSVPGLVADFSSNKQKLKRLIGTVNATGETALYDAFLLAAKQTSKSKLKQKFIILLSDGADTVSKTKLQDCIQQVNELKVPVYTIGLKTPEFDMGILKNISSQSGGKLIEASALSDLKPLYSRLATQMKNNIEIEYKSPGFSTKDIDLDITVGKNSKALSISTAYKNPAFLNAYAGPDSDVKIKPIVDSWIVRFAILLVTFVAALLFVYGAISTLFREKSLLKQQMGMYEDIWNSTVEQDKKLSSDNNPYVSKALDLVGYFAEQRGFTDLVREKLEQAGLPLRPREYIFFHSLTVLVLGTLVQLASGTMMLSMLSVILLTVVPILMVQITIDRRKNRFNEMLPDTVTMLAGSLRAGYSLLQAISLVADESKPPISTEFKRALTEARLGLPIEAALEKMADRIGSRDFYWTVLAINIQREVGGNLAEVLDIVARTIREREGLKRHIKTLTAEGRLSAYILIALPFAVTGLLLIMNTEYMMTLFTHVLGWLMIAIAGVLMVIGIIWMKKIISIEV